MDFKSSDEEVDMDMDDVEMAETKSDQNVVNPTVTLDKIEKSTAFDGIFDDYGKVVMHLLDQEKFVERENEFGEITSTAVMGPQLPFDNLQPQDRLEFSDLASNPNSVLFGKYLLCQTISFARERVALCTVITDPKGQLAIPLALHNYSFRDNSEFEVNADDILPPGIFLVVKNPCFKRLLSGRLILISENPADVELVSRKRLEAKFPDLGWEGEIAEKTLYFSQKQSFWSDIEGDELAFLKLKELGHKGLFDKRFSDAIRFYDMALDYCNENGEDEAMIQSNKSAALLGLGCFNAALECTQFPLDVDPGNEKHIYRKTKALIGLGKYEVARIFLESKFNQFSSLSKSNDCKNLLETVKFLCSRKNLGPTKSQLLSIYKNTVRDADKFSEFKGPLAVASEMEGKGRGLVATEDIRPGQLLLCSKAFAYHSTPSDSNELDPYEKTTHGSDSDCKKMWQDKIVKKIANKLLFDPELRPEFYNLTAGAERGHLELGDPSIGHLDMVRILEIVKINTFQQKLHIFASRKESSEKTDDKTKSTGLWIVPSLLNHSCSENNAEWHISGEVLTLTAIAEINKGEEVTISYISPINDYETRQSYFKDKGFNCNCKLCQLDAKEPIPLRKERKEIFKSLGQLTRNCGPGEIRKALEAVKRLVTLRKNDISLNFPLLSPEVFRFGQILFYNDHYGDFISILKPMFEVANASTCWHTEGILMAVNLFLSYLLKGNRKLTKVWTDNVKRLMMKFYGHLELVRDTALEQLMIKLDIDFFQEDD